MAYIYIYIIHTINRRMVAELYTFKKEMSLVLVKFCVYFFDYSKKNTTNTYYLSGITQSTLIVTSR